MLSFEELLRKADLIERMITARMDAKADAKARAKARAKAECREKALFSRTGRMVKPATVRCGTICRQKKNCKVTKTELKKVRSAFKGKTKQEITSAIKALIAAKKAGQSSVGATYEVTKDVRAEQGKQRQEKRYQKSVAAAEKRAKDKADKEKAAKKKRRTTKAVDPVPPAPQTPFKQSDLVTVVTSREALTQKGDLSLIPDRLKPFLGEVQQEGVALAIAAMRKTGGFLNADGTGTGKTRQQLAVAQAFADEGKKVLIVSPAEVIKPSWSKGTMTGSFESDAKAMGIDVELSRGEKPLKPGKIRVTTYDPKSFRSFLGQVDSDTVILFDEAHSFKNADSGRTIAGKKLIDQAGSVMFATATPADKPSHLHYLERAGVFQGRKQRQVFEWLGMEEGTYGWKPPAYANGVEKLNIKMSGLFDDMTEQGTMVKREISMEGLSVNYKKIGLPAIAYEEQNKIEQKYRELQEDANRDYSSRHRLNFRSMNDEPKGLLRSRMLFDQRRQLEPYKVPATIEETMSALEKGNQVIIFASRVNFSTVKGAGKDAEVIAESEGTVKLLKAALEEAGVPTAEIAELHGGATKTAKSKKAAMDQFQSGQARVMISTVESGGTGINLDDRTGTNPRTMIMMTSQLSAMGDVQAVGRIARLTTQSTPEVIYMSTDTGADQWGEGLTATKLASLGATIKGIPLANLTEQQRMELGIADGDNRVRMIPPRLKSDFGPEWEDVSRDGEDGYRGRNKKTGQYIMTNTRSGLTAKGEYVKKGEGYISPDKDGNWNLYHKDDILNPDRKPEPASITKDDDIELSGSPKQVKWSEKIMWNTIGAVVKKEGIPKSIIYELFSQRPDLYLQAKWWIDNRAWDSGNQSDFATHNFLLALEEFKKSRQDSLVDYLGSSYFGLNPHPFRKPLWR